MIMAVHIAHSVGVKQTAEMIRRARSVLVVRKRSWVPTPSGGLSWVLGPQVAPQDCRLSRAGAEDEQERMTLDGRAVQIEWLILCMPDVNLSVGDLADIDGHEYEIVAEAEVPSWRRTFEAVRNG